MAKKSAGEIYLNKLDPKTKSFINTMKLEALAAGGMKGQKRNPTEAWLQHVNRVMADDRTAPPPLIAINSKTGKPMTYDEVAKFKKIAKNNAVTIAEDVFYIAANSQGKQALKGQFNLEENELKKYTVPWGKYSAQSGQIMGTAKNSALDKEIKTIQSKYLIERVPRPSSKLSEESAQKIVRNYLEAEGITLRSNSAAVKFGIIVTDNSAYEELYIIRVKGPKLKGEGGRTPFIDSTDYDNYIYATPLEGPFNNVLPDKASKQASSIAHWRTAEKTKNIEQVVKFYEKNISEIENLIDIEKESAEKSTKVIQEYEKALDHAEKELAEIKEVLTDTENATSIVADFTKDPQRLSVSDPAFIDAKSRVKFTNNSVTIPVITNQKTKVSVREVTITGTFAANLLSRKDIGIFFDSPQAFNGGAQSAAEKMGGKKVVEIFNLASSYSPLKYAMLESLSTIFDDKELRTAAKKKKPKDARGKVNVTIGKKGKKVKPLQKQKKQTRNSSLFKNAMPMLSKRTKRGKRFKAGVDFKTAEKSELLTIINSNLREAVMSNMGYPSLVNRTGRFASSVEAIDIINNIVIYRYRLRPYVVFEQRRGRSPWNSKKERDPIGIINSAIRSLQSNLQGELSNAG